MSGLTRFDAHDATAGPIQLSSRISVASVVSVVIRRVGVAPGQLAAFSNQMRLIGVSAVGRDVGAAERLMGLHHPQRVMDAGDARYVFGAQPDLVLKLPLQMTS
jgi:hypothetical protein